MIRHYYHVWADGAWQEPVTEHARALRESGFPAPALVTLIGDPENRRQVADWLDSELPGGWQLNISAPSGWEGVTLRGVWDDARQPGRPRYPVLYAHSKGAYTTTVFQAAWRRAMTRAVVGGWRDAAAVIEGGKDAAGCHWLPAGLHPAPAGPAWACR